MVDFKPVVPVVMGFASLLLLLGCDIIPNLYHAAGGRVAICLGGDGQYQFGLEEEPNTLYLVDPAADSARALTDGKSLVTFPCIHQDAVFYVRDQRHIHRVSHDGKDDRELYGLKTPAAKAVDPKDPAPKDPPEAPKQPVIWYPSPSPDGKQLAWFEVDEVDQPARLRLMPLAGGEPRTLLERALMPLRWRADGKQLLSFVAEKPVPQHDGFFTGALMHIDIVGGERRTLHRGQFWFHNGLVLCGPLAVFTELDVETRSSRLRTIALDGAAKASESRTKEGAFDFYPASSPSGRRWAFTRAQPGVNGLAGPLFLAEIDPEKGEIQRELPLGELGRGILPVFLDEETIILATPDQKDGRLYRYDIKQAKVTRIDEDWRKLVRKQ